MRNLDTKTKVGLGFAIFVIGSGFWWAGTITADMTHVKLTIKPIPEMQQDIAAIKAIITSNPMAHD